MAASDRESTGTERYLTERTAAESMVLGVGTIEVEWNRKWERKRRRDVEGFS